ncbi:hypothetical protein CQA57_05180 [Helicobacter anseris]|uniref:Uncharacterized protein n=1 Tax=Helicobacter anseris TaxID=375926 RepID=A0A3D8J8W2_9HELI|nr:hypothetical protein [Helicobacter anseris]RDU73281.1 hypothetical protein CQA57_05180 [Helicobacter anseris]
MHKPALKSMKVFLQSKGYDVEHKDFQEVFDIYKNVCLQETTAYQNEVFDTSFFDISGANENVELIALSQVIKTEIEQIQNEPQKLYVLIDRYIEQCPYEELKFLIFSGVKKLPFLTMDRIFKIKYYQYQEVWMEKIEQHLDVLPQEEKKVLMHHYDKMRDNIPLLFRAYQKSFDTDEVEKMRSVAENKLLLLQNFNPQMLEENYKAFYDESPEKIKLVKEVLSLTSSYTKSFLKHIPMEELLSLIEEIKKQKRDEEESKKRIIKHIKILEESIAMASDGDFDIACMSAIEELNNEELQKVLHYLGSQNKFFVNKFESVAKQFGSNFKAKVF